MTLTRKIQSVLTAFVLGASLLLAPTPASAAPETYSSVTDHQDVGNCNLFGGAPAGVVRIHYRAVFRKTHSLFTFPAQKAVYPTKIVIRQRHHDSLICGNWPFGISKVIYHVNIRDDALPPLSGRVERFVYEMSPSYYKQTFRYNVTGTISLAKHPRVCVHVHFKINFNPDVHESMGCKYMTW